MMRKMTAPARATDEPKRRQSARVGRSAMGERLGGYIYGTIVALAVVVAGAKAYPHGPGHIAVLVAVTAVAFWLAHVYAHGLGHSVAHDEHLTIRELRRIARREASIIEATVPPVAPLVLGALGVLSTRASVWAAFGVGLLVLAIEGIEFARVERLGWLGTVAVVAGNLSLGLVLVALKLLVTH
jgi:hypothetical protein